MEHSLRSIIGFSIRATDGDLGKVNEFYFDDTTWTIRYMVVETGSWLSNRKVLISLFAMGKPDWESRTFPVNLTRDQIRNSPDIDTERPVYRQHEAQLHQYYEWPQYWEPGYGGILGITPFPLLEIPVPQESPDPDRHDDPHLRSTRQVTGYHIHATNGEIGHVTDFKVDDEGWRLCNLVVDTGSWLPGKKVIIPVAWIKNVDWAEAAVYVDRMRESVKNSPDVDPSKAADADHPGSL
jgi:sporulation protein YlmC with PRC-barrel domain